MTFHVPTGSAFISFVTLWLLFISSGNVLEAQEHDQGKQYHRPEVKRGKRYSICPVPLPFPVNTSLPERFLPEKSEVAKRSFSFPFPSKRLSPAQLKNVEMKMPSWIKAIRRQNNILYADFYGSYDVQVGSARKAVAFEFGNIIQEVDGEKVFRARSQFIYFQDFSPESGEIDIDVQTPESVSLGPKAIWKDVRENGVYLYSCLAEIPEGKSVGPCNEDFICEKSEFALAKPNSYLGSIEPILLEKCLQCHREGRAKPFLGSWEGVEKHKQAIVDAVESGRMPILRDPKNPTAVPFAATEPLSSQMQNAFKLWKEGGYLRR